MSHQHRRGRPVAWSYDIPPKEVLADPFASAKAISELLPTALADAEAAGLSIIGQYLAKALQLSRGIVASGQARSDSASAAASTRNLQ